MHKKLGHAIAILILLSGAVLGKEKLPKANRVPSAPTAEQKALISEGILLHDAGQYDNAILKYKQVLEESPDVVEAIYELGFSYFYKKDYENALAVARRGAQYRSDMLPQFYVILGNTLDDIGRRGQAIDFYKAAIKQSPGTALLHFNLGLTLLRSGKNPEAKREVQQSLYLAPNHAGSHYVLASLYDRLGYRIPAILALSRFLLIEPDSQRSREALLMLDRLIGGGVSKGNKPNEIKITLALTPQSRKDEGDFDPVEVAMSMSLAAAQMEEAKEQSSQFKLLAATYAVMAEVMSRTAGNGFAARYYAPFYAEMDKRGYIEAFVGQAFQTARLAGSAGWTAGNNGKRREFQIWLTGYQWPNSK